MLTIQLLTQLPPLRRRRWLHTAEGRCGKRPAAARACQVADGGLDCRAFPPKERGKSIAPGSDAVIVAQRVHVHNEIVGLEMMETEREHNHGA